MENSIPYYGPERPHTIYRYTDQIYKIVQFYDVRPLPGPKAPAQHHEEKLEQSLSRARRVVLEKALCNPWDWFCTFTIAPDKADRNDLEGFWKRFSQFLRDQRKKFPGLAYLLVPEKHRDGAWHCHGLLVGLPDSELLSFDQMDKDGFRLPSGKRLPRSLRDSEYMNWSAYSRKFGFCSLGRIKCPEAAAFYVCKYIQKDTARLVSSVGLHTYYVSQNLNAAVKHLDFYGWDPEIEKFLTHSWDFCRTGMTHLRDKLDSSFMYEWELFRLQLEALKAPEPSSAIVADVEDYCRLDQLRLF